ncbi:MAG: hypothetical protein QOH56_4276 [Pseudonocardiales bacterium]|nr:hypothetical protein [Pseudonocardiales bacterium]
MTSSINLNRPTDANGWRSGDLLLGVILSMLGACWLAYQSRLSASGTAPSIAITRETLANLAFAFPAVLLAVPAALLAARRRYGPRDLPTWFSAVVVAPTAATALASAHLARAVLGGTASAGLPVTALAGDALTGLAVMMPVAYVVLCLRRLRVRDFAGSGRAALIGGLGLASVVSTALVSSSQPAVAGPASTAATCLSGGAVTRSFDITALDVNIPLNRYGDHDPKGKMYALNSKLGQIADEQRTQQVSIGLRDDPIQALVIRANEGDCVEIRYVNTASGGDYGIHIDGLEFNTSSSGDSIGNNPSSAVPRGATMSYRFAVPNDPRMEGAHYLHPGPGYRSAVNHGLFGALVIEPPGSTYWNASKAGMPQDSGWEAIIKPAGTDVACMPALRSVATCGFREAALLHHEIGNDNETVLDKFNKNVPQVDETTGSYRPGAFALNYRSEPFRNRLLQFSKEKSHAYSSYTFGDPATPMPRGYLSDPTKIRLLHAGGEKFHIYHLHGGGDRWRYNPVADTTYNYADTGLRKDPETQLSPSQRLDSQSMGPGESYNLEIEGGAGGVQQSSGDFLFHCHIAKHYVSGMWSFWRVYSTLQPDLVPLPDRPAPLPAVDSSQLIGKTFNDTTITKDNLEDWIRPQLPPSGVPQSGQDPTVWDWKTSGTPDAPVYLGAPLDPTRTADSANVIAGQPNALAVDAGNLIGNRPKILFDQTNGRPAYPLFRTNVGKRPPFTPAGHTGAPWLGNNTAQNAKSATDPWAKRSDGLCPNGRKVDTFNVVAIGKSIRRSPTLVDPEGKIFVLAKDKQDVLDGTKPDDPLAIRMNQGECGAVTLTNEIPDSSAFDGWSKTTMHIHHVQFDVQGSDGVSAGFAFEHSVRPYQVSDSQLVAEARKGSQVLQLSSVTKFIGTDSNANPIKPWIAVGEGTDSIDIHQIVAVDAAAKTVTLADGLQSDHAASEWAGSEFIQYRWYPDVVLDNIFWHDHVDGIHGWGHGLVGQLIVEPSGSTYHDPVTGKQVDSGTLVDIHTSNPLAPGLVTGNFRELALWTIDDNDKSDYSTLNLRANPLAARLDAANRFSSFKYDDPLTPLPRMYPNDPLVIRTINVGPSIDTLHLQGGQTLLEPRYGHDNSPDGSIIDTIHYGVSEKYTLVFNGQRPDLKMAAGDYLYVNGDERRTQQGAWGIVRVLPGKVSDLQPLGGSVPGPSGDYTLPTMTGLAPPPTAGPGYPCPTGAPSHQFSVTAMDTPGSFSGSKTAFVPSADVTPIKNGTRKFEPLVLHAVAGECVTVHLANQRSAPVGFSVSKLSRTAGSGGVNVGFSTDQNTAPKTTRDYTYYVSSDRIGTASIADLAGANTPKSGLYGAVVVSSASTLPGQRTTFSDPVSGAPRDIGTQVLVHVPGALRPDYRDFTTIIADDDPKIGQDFMPYPTNAEVGKTLLNYQAAPAGDGPGSFRNPGSVPYLTSYVGDPEVVHVLVAPGSENAHVFSLGGLRWSQDSFLENSSWTAAQGLGPWESINAWVVGGAGGTQQSAGDYFYGDLRRPFTQIGVWGIQRVLPAPAGTCPIRRVDNSPC